MVRRGAHVVGFDQSPALVELARRRTDGAVDLRVHDLAEPLDWVADACFDLVVLALTLNYVDNRLAMLREFRRVLLPEGALVISTTHPTADWERLGGSYFAAESVEESLSPQHDWPVRAWRRPLAAVCDEFSTAGFLIERLVEPRPVPEMAVRDPESYARLEHAPAFIAFRLGPTPDAFR
jgi:ubiquinone/menaquinone biosynthesis C-methylase UbiE